MRKNFILTMLMFLFINILSIANENLPAVNTNINNMNPAYDESLKEYKIQVENTEKLYNYIEKTIKENSITTVFTKLENSNLVASDENGNIIFIEKLPENLSKTTTYFEAKQIYQLKNGKTLSYSEMDTELLGKKVKMKYETLMKTKMNKKDAIKVLKLAPDLTTSINNVFSNIEYFKFEVYDTNNNLLQRMNYRNNKMTIEQEVEGNQAKIIYLFDNTNSMSGKVEAYKNGELISILQIKNLLPEGEVKIFYPGGRLLTIFNLKNGQIDGMMKMFFENGKLMGVANFKDGLQDGEAIEYDKNGNVIKKVLYKNGNIVK